MKTYILHHTPKSAAQDTWAVSFSLPYIATGYVRAGDGVWYVRTWLTADQISKRLAILFDTADELRVVELDRKEAGLSNRMQWLQGRLEDDEPSDLFNAPRVMWEALHNAAQSFVLSRSVAAPAMATNLRNSRAA
jgi:hypothetical protein